VYALNGLGVASASDLGAFWNKKRRRAAPRPIAHKVVGRSHPVLLKHAKPLKLQFRRSVGKGATPTSLARSMARMRDRIAVHNAQASTSGLGDATTMVGGVLAVGAVAAAAYFLFGKQLGLKKNPRRRRRSRRRSRRR